MKHIEWTEALSLGVEQLDNEHKQLIALSNDLIDSVKTNDREHVRSCFHALREYTVVHFQNEENYMAKIHYPDIEKHKLEHVNLKAEVKHYQESVYHRTDLVPADVVAFIKHWLIDHVIYLDMNIKIYAMQQA